MAVKFEEANPGVDITVVQQGGDITTNGAQFQAASIAGNGPDIRIQYAGGPTISFADFFTDLEPYLTPEIIDSMAGFNVNREGFKPDGRMLGMPYGAGNMFTVFANNEMLVAAGLDPAAPPQTWEELMANGQQILDTTGQVPFWVANLEGYVGAWVVSALAGGELGETIFTRMYTGEVPINDPAMVKVYEKWAEFGASGLTNPDAGQVSNGDSTAGFVQGKGAYYIVGSWENNNMIENFGDNVSTFFIPMLEGAAYPKMGAGGPEIALSITEYSEQQGPRGCVPALPGPAGEPGRVRDAVPDAGVEPQGRRSLAHQEPPAAGAVQAARGVHGRDRVRLRQRAAAVGDRPVLPDQRGRVPRQHLAAGRGRPAPGRQPAGDRPAMIVAAARGCRLGDRPRAEQRRGSRAT